MWNEITGTLTCLLAAVSVAGCAPAPLKKYSTETPPIVLVPAFAVGVTDGRARFREIFCAATDAHGEQFEDHGPCEEALLRLGGEPEPTGRPVHLGKSTSSLKFAVVPGVGMSCIKGTIIPPGLDEGEVETIKGIAHVKTLGFQLQHELPASVKYYSLITFPDRDHVSRGLIPSYDKLSQVDPRNDSAVIFYDQMIPGGTLLGYLQADHWAVILPIDRTYPTLAKVFFDQNEFPREIMFEAIMRFVEEDLTQAE